MGTSPVLEVDDLILQDSGAITQFLLEKYDTLGYLLPKDPTRRAQVYLYIHAAESTFLVPGLSADIGYVFTKRLQFNGWPIWDADSPIAMN